MKHISNEGHSGNDQALICKFTVNSIEEAEAFFDALEVLVEPPDSDTIINVAPYTVAREFWFYPYGPNGFKVTLNDWRTRGDKADSRWAKATARVGEHAVIYFCVVFETYDYWEDRALWADPINDDLHTYLAFKEIEESPAAMQWRDSFSFAVLACEDLAVNRMTKAINNILEPKAT